MANLRDFEHSLPMELLKAREAAMSRFRPMLRDHGLTEQQWRVIRALAHYGEIDAGELAQRSFLLAPSLTRILRERRPIALLSATTYLNLVALWARRLSGSDARILGSERERGTLRRGARADLVVLDAAGGVRETGVAGRRRFAIS